jgi:hypothetical protein
VLSFDLGPPLPFPENGSPPPPVFLSCMNSSPTLTCVGGDWVVPIQIILLDNSGTLSIHNTQFTTEAMKYSVPLPSHCSFPDPYGEINDIQRKPREISQLGRKSAEVNHCLYTVVQQSNGSWHCEPSIKWEYYPGSNYFPYMWGNVSHT